MKSTPVLCELTWLLVFSSSADGLVEAHFTSAQLSGMDLPPAHGTWKIAEGLPTCTQDDALCAKNKDQGPVIWCNPAFTDATVRFAIRSEKTRNFVFMLNDDEGHAFRYVLDAKVVSVRAWKAQGHDAKPDELPAANSTKLAGGTGIQAELKFVGERCSPTISRDPTRTFQHPAVPKKKTKMGLGFIFGMLSVRDVSNVGP